MAIGQGLNQRLHQPQVAQGVPSNRFSELLQPVGALRNGAVEQVEQRGHVALRRRRSPGSVRQRLQWSRDTGPSESGPHLAHNARQVEQGARCVARRSVQHFVHGIGDRHEGRHLLAQLAQPLRSAAQAIVTRRLGRARD